MYKRFSVYKSSREAERIEDCFCDKFGQSHRFGNDRQSFVERKIEQMIEDIVREWEATNPRKSEI